MARAERRWKVLLVEDDPVYRKVVHGMLLRGGAPIDVQDVGGAKDALEFLRREPFDCVLLDQFLPDYLGTEFLQVLAARQEKTPVIMLSGLGSRQTSRDAKDLGAKLVLDKAGLTPEILMEAVMRVLRLPRAK